MEKKSFKDLDSNVKRVIFDCLSYYDFLNKQKTFVLKRKEFSFDTEYVLLDSEDIKVISLLLGLLSTDNYMNGYLNTQGINRPTVLKYLNIEEFILEPIKTSEIDLSINVFSFLKDIMETELNLDTLTKALFNKFNCNSDIVYNYYYSSISSNIVDFSNIKEELRKSSQINSNYIKTADFELIAAY